MIHNLNELQRNNNLKIRKLANEFYLLSDSGSYVVNIIGAIIVNNIGKDIKMSDFILRLSEKFNYDDTEQINSDICEFIEFLCKEDLAKIL